MLRQDLHSACFSNEGAFPSSFGKTTDILGCNWMFSPLFLLHVLHKYFCSETVPLLVAVMMIVIMIMIFIVSCLIAAADTPRKCLSGGQ